MSEEKDSPLLRLKEHNLEAVQFFRERKRVVDLWPEEESRAKGQEPGLIAKFFLPKEDIAAKPLQNYPERIAEILSGIKALYTRIGGDLDENDDCLDENTAKSADIIYMQLGKTIKQFENRIAKFHRAAGQLDPAGDAEAIREEFSKLLRDLFQRLADETLDPIRRGFELSSNAMIYEILLEDVNQFLRGIRVYTKDIKIGQKMDFDFCDYADTNGSKETENYELRDCVYEIRQFPYLTEDGILLVPGRVMTWELKNRG